MKAFNYEYHLLYASLMYLIINENYKSQNIKLGLIGIIGCLSTFFVPDIDIKSKASKKLPIISWFVQLLTNHHGFTHSLLALVIIYEIFKLTSLNNLAIGAVIGYGSHLVTDITTNNGITLFWPVPIKIRIPIIRHFNKVIKILWILILMYILAEYDNLMAEIQKLYFR